MYAFYMHQHIKCTVGLYVGNPNDLYSVDELQWVHTECRTRLRGGLYIGSCGSRSGRDSADPTAHKPSKETHPWSNGSQALERNTRSVCFFSPGWCYQPGLKAGFAVTTRPPWLVPSAANVRARTRRPRTGLAPPAVPPNPTASEQTSPFM